MPNTVLGKVSVVPRGDYSASTTYYALDIVGYNGGSYLAMQQVTGVTPSNDGVNWMQLSGPGLPGKQGPQGNPGAAAGFGEATATVDDTSGTPSVEVETSGPDTAKVFTFKFYGLKGTKGDTGDKGNTGDTGPTGPQGVSVVTAQINEQGHLIITLSEGEPIDAGDATGPIGPQGIQGEAGESVGSIQRTSGTGAPGTTDTYTMYSTDGSEIGTFTVYNGQNGTGAGDFMADGSVPMTGNLDMNGNRVTEVGTPTADTDAANKAYVDEALSDKQSTLTGTEDQLVGFNSAGEATAVSKPTAADVGAMPAVSGGTAGQVLTKGDGETVTWSDPASGLPDGGTEGQILEKTADSATWTDKPLGSPARVNILETICENVELADYGAVYTFPAPIEIDSDAIYLLRYSSKEVYEGETYEYGTYAFTNKANKDDSSVSWMSGNVTMISTTVTDNNLWDGETSNISIYKVTIEVTDQITYIALHSGEESLIPGKNGHAEGWRTIASGLRSHAEGSATTASGNKSHAEGDSTTASGNNSHAEGTETTATGASSHAEGRNTTASGNYSHAEGYYSTASGEASHAEGSYTIASISWSHAEGCGTIAASRYQHVQGTYNIEDPSDTYAHIVGNGEDDDNRSNAHTLDWDGNAWFAGEVYVGGTSQSDGSKLMHEPPGGTTGQILEKTATGTQWADKPSGGMTQSDADARYLQLSGGTMTGALALPGNPTSDNQAANKAYVDALKPNRLTAVLSASGWSGNSQTITVNGVITNTSAQDIDISCADKASADAWAAGGVWCSNPTTANRLTFTCTTPPTANINLNIRLWEVG